MAAEIHIDRVRFDLTAESLAAFDAAYDQITRDFDRVYLPLLERMFAGAIADAGADHVIDRIEIDYTALQAVVMAEAVEGLGPNAWPTALPDLPTPQITTRPVSDWTLRLMTYWAKGAVAAGVSPAEARAGQQALAEMPEEMSETLLDTALQAFGGGANIAALSRVIADWPEARWAVLCQKFAYETIFADVFSEAKAEGRMPPRHVLLEVLEEIIFGVGQVETNEEPPAVAAIESMRRSDHEPPADKPKAQSQIPSPVDASPSQNGLPATAVQPSERPKQTTELPQGILIENAGIIVMWPYLMTLFERVGLLKGDQFATKKDQNRAITILHFLATGDPNPTEPEAVLYGLLVGKALGEPLGPPSDLTPEICTHCEDALIACITHWQKLKGTSIDGLRSSFLQRAGRLDMDEGDYHLTLEKGPFDMLLDSLPYPISIIRLPLMDAPLHVNWGS